jgi:hypothetical protein
LKAGSRRLASHLVCSSGLNTKDGPEGEPPTTFDSVALLTSGIGAAAGARGEDVAREPSLTSPVEVPASAKGKGGRNLKATVDVYVPSSATARSGTSPTRRSRSRWSS